MAGHKNNTTNSDVYIDGNGGFRAARYVAGILGAIQGHSRGRMIATNLVSYGLAVMLVSWFIPIAAVSRKLGGQAAVQPYQRFFASIQLFLFGINVRSRYHQDIDASQNYLLMFEHMHSMDMFLLSTTWFKIAYGIAALEYKNLPVAGQIMTVSGTRFIERRDTQKAIQDLQRLAQELQQESGNIMVAPTGTRKPTAEYPPFKKGVFHLALSLGLPIVPVYLVGMERLADDTTFSRGGDVHMVYGKPIPVGTPGADDAQSLLDLTYNTMHDEAKSLRQTVFASDR